MRKSLLVGIVAASAAVASADYTTWSSGDLGNNVINDAGQFQLFPNLVNPSNVHQAWVDVTYGLWNSPDVTVDVSLNGTIVGTFIADQGYISPGPESVTFEVTGLLLNGANTLTFDGYGANTGDYVVGMAELRYFSVPTPGAVSLLTLGGLLGLRRRR